MEFVGEIHHPESIQQLVNISWIMQSSITRRKVLQTLVMSKISITFLLIAIVFTSGCLGNSSTLTPDATTTTEGDISMQTTSDVPTPVTETTPTRTANIGTADRPWDVMVWHMRSSAFSATVRIEQNDTGAVVSEEDLPLEPDESQELTVDYPAVGNYTLTVTVRQSDATPPPVERGTVTPTATGTEAKETVMTYGYEIEVVPPSYELIVLLEADGGVDIYMESA